MANQIAVGSGTLNPEDRRQIVNTWTQQVEGDRPKEKADPRKLAAVGIGVRLVTKAPPSE